MRLYCIGSGDCYECSGGAAYVFASYEARAAYIEAYQSDYPFARLVGEEDADGRFVDRRDGLYQMELDPETGLFDIVAPLPRFLDAEATTVRAELENR